ncbi:hypothetical protein ACFVVM_05940 [Nocardia sp. NPDC058176]|uniref:hypothetical protein n=1 Tax=Nocardia sp. NPDC058176 TaxID=3346368 RepID=UPI0036D8F9FF
MAQPPVADPTILAGGYGGAQQPVADPTILAGGQFAAPPGTTPPPGSGQYSQPAISQPYAYPQQQYPPQYAGQQPYQQQPGYAQQPYGYAPQAYPGPPRRNGGSGTIVAVVALIAVVVIGGAVALAYAAGAFDDSSTAASATTSVTPTGPLTGTSTAPVSPGAQGVLIPEYRVAYDVPTAWTIDSEYASVSLTGRTGTFAGRGKTFEGASFCPGSAYRALAGVGTSTESDPAAAATAVAKISAESGYSDSTGGKLTTPTSLTTQSGLTGQFVETSGPWTPRVAGCTVNAYSVYTFAFQNAAGQVLALTILADRNATGELTAAEAKKMITSLRLV